MLSINVAVAAVGSFLFLLVKNAKFFTGNADQIEPLVSSHAINMEGAVSLIPSNTEVLDRTSNDDAKVTMETRTSMQFVCSTLSLLVAPKMLCVAPLFFYMGNNMVYYGSQFTRQITDSTYIGYSMSVLGAAEVIGSYFAGYLNDKVGRNSSK